MTKAVLLCLGLLASACGSAPTAEHNKPAVGDPTRAAVTAYLKKTLDDPASYQPARWGRPKPFQQRDVDIDKAGNLILEYRHQNELGKMESEHFIRMSDLSLTPKDGLKELGKAKRILAIYKQRADSVMKLSQKLAASTDTTQLGRVITHAFRAKNKMGALVLDSAVFTVLKNGQVEVQSLSPAE